MSSEVRAVPQAVEPPRPEVTRSRAVSRVVGGSWFLAGAGSGAALGLVSVATGTPWLVVPALVAWIVGLVVERRNVPDEPAVRLFTFYFIDDDQVTAAVVQIQEGQVTDWAQMVSEIRQLGGDTGRFGIGLRFSKERRRELLTALRQTSINRFRLLHAYLRSGTPHQTQRLRPFDPANPGAPVAADSYLEVTVPASQIFGQGDTDLLEGDEPDKRVEAAGAACDMTYVLARGNGTPNLSAAAGNVLALCRVDEVHEAADGRAYGVRVYAVYR